MATTEKNNESLSNYIYPKNERMAQLKKTTDVEQHSNQRETTTRLFFFRYEKKTFDRIYIPTVFKDPLKDSLLINGARETGQQFANETESLSYTIHKYQHK